MTDPKRTWHDYVFLIGGFFFAATLLPTALDPASQVSRWTSGPTALVLVAYGFTFDSRNMRLSSVGSFASASVWWLIFVLRAP